MPSVCKGQYGFSGQKHRKAVLSSLPGASPSASSAWLPGRFCSRKTPQDRTPSQRLFWLLAGISPFTHRGHGTRRTAERARIHLPEGVLSAGLSRLRYAPENARRPRVKLSIKNGRPMAAYTEPHLCGSLPGTAVGAPIGRPSCPVHSAWPSAGRAILLGGRWRPLRRPHLCNLLRNRRRGAHWAPALPRPARFSAGRQFAFGGQPMAAPTRGRSDMLAFQRPYAMKRTGKRLTVLYDTKYIEMLTFAGLYHNDLSDLHKGCKMAAKKWAVPPIVEIITMKIVSTKIRLNGWKNAAKNGCIQAEVVRRGVRKMYNGLEEK